MIKKWMSFEEAKEFTHTLKLKTPKEWRMYCVSGKKPKNIPSRPKQIYKKEWKGNKDWLGNGKIKFISFSEARQFTQSLKISSYLKWLEYCKSDKRPKNIPSTPNKIYKEWEGWADFLGYEKNPKKKYRSFVETKKFVVKIGIKSQSEWAKYCKSGKKPKDIPSTLHRTYKEWKGCGDFFGTGNLSSSQISKKYISFDEAKQFVQSLKLKNQEEWKEYCKSGKRPDTIPSAPNITYKKEWKGVGDWLGTGTVHGKLKKFRSLSESRKFVKSLGLKNWDEWFEYCKSGNKPDDIPTVPWKIYSKKRKK
jgi:hypothetical protein